MKKNTKYKNAIHVEIHVSYVVYKFVHGYNFLIYNKLFTIGKFTVSLESKFCFQTSCFLPLSFFLLAQLLHLQWVVIVDELQKNNSRTMNQCLFVLFVHV